MTFELGYQPEKFKVRLAAGSDFFASLRRSDGTDWPTTSELTLDFGNGTIWEAELSGALATWDEDQDDVDALITARPKKVRLWYVDGEVRLLWAAGTVVAS